MLSMPLKIGLQKRFWGNVEIFARYPNHFSFDFIIDLDVD